MHGLVMQIQLFHLSCIIYYFHNYSAIDQQLDTIKVRFKYPWLVIYIHSRELIMKVSELLSAPTVGSSRALTAYSIALLAILVTGTKFSSIPGIGQLEGDETSKVNIAVAVLVFMSLSHFVNWLNDVRSNEASAARDEFEFQTRPIIHDQPVVSHEEFLDERRIQGNEIYLKRREFERFSDDRFAYAYWVDRTKKRSRMVNWILQNAMHLTVPFVLSSAALVGLGIRLYLGIQQ